MTKLKHVNGLNCPNCRRGILFFVRFWLNTEVRECDHCHIKYSYPTERRT